jgi:hypothetical protein
MNEKIQLAGHERIDRRTFALCRVLVRYMELECEEDRRKNLQKALDNIARWRDNGVHCAIYDEWEKIIKNEGWKAIRKLLLEETQYGTQMRQTNPFVGILPKLTVKNIYQKY